MTQIARSRRTDAAWHTCVHCAGRISFRERLIKSLAVIPAHAGIHQHIDFQALDSESALRSARNDKLITGSLVTNRHAERRTPVWA